MKKCEKESRRQWGVNRMEYPPANRDPEKFAKTMFSSFLVYIDENAIANTYKSRNVVLNEFSSRSTFQNHIHSS